MKAIVFTRFGPPMDVLRLEEVPRPVPGPGPVLVKIHATAVNDWDWSYVRGQPYPYSLFFGLRRPKRTIRKLTTKTVAIVALKPHQGLPAINEHYATHGLELVIDGPYPLEEVPRAIQRFGDAKHLGKVVVTIAH